MAVPKEAITPGSTEYGTRQTLEQGLQQGSVGGGSPLGGGSPSPAPATVPQGGNAISDMLAGKLQAGGDQPLTEGLSVGPGGGPVGQPQAGPLDNDLGNKLKMIASQSTSPTLRRLAVNKLRSMYREGTRGS